MTKKHFIALADTIRGSRENWTAKQLDELGDFCYSQNPRFKWGIWLGYINGENGPNGGKITRKEKP